MKRNVRGLITRPLRRLLGCTGDEGTGPRTGREPRDADKVTSEAAVACGAGNAPERYVVPPGNPRHLAYAFNGFLLGSAGDSSEVELNALERRVEHQLRRSIQNGLVSAQVPRLPSTVPQLLEQLDRSSTVAEIADQIQRDPALAGEVLHLANTAYFRRAREPIETIEKAFWTLGEDGLRALLVAGAMRPAFRLKAVYFRLFGRLLWQHAVDCGHACRTFARSENIDGPKAFFAGLIHDIGKLVVFRHALCAFSEIGPDSAPRASAFSTLIHRYAPELTTAVCDSWHIPEAIKLAIREQFQREEIASPLGRVLYTADIVSQTHMLLREKAMKRSELVGHMRAGGVPWLKLYEAFPDDRDFVRDQRHG